MIHLFIPLFAFLLILGVLSVIDAIRHVGARHERRRANTWQGQAAYYRSRRRR